MKIINHRLTELEALAVKNNIEFDNTPLGYQLPLEGRMMLLDTYEFMDYVKGELGIDTPNCIALLDLNFTLAEQCEMSPYNPKMDVYSKELAYVLSKQGFDIHLITARPYTYERETLAKIKKDLDLRLARAVFKSAVNMRINIPIIKSEYYKSLVDNEGVLPEDVIAVESNSRTRSAYNRFGLTKVWKRTEFLNHINGRD